jgi:hypothetical protein
MSFGRFFSGGAADSAHMTARRVQLFAMAVLLFMSMDRALLILMADNGGQFIQR